MKKCNGMAAKVLHLAGNVQKWGPDEEFGDWTKGLDVVSANEGSGFRKRWKKRMWGGVVRRGVGVEMLGGKGPGLGRERQKKDVASRGRRDAKQGAGKETG